MTVALNTPFFSLFLPYLYSEAIKVKFEYSSPFPRKPVLIVAALFNDKGLLFPSSYNKIPNPSISVATTSAFSIMEAAVIVNDTSPW